MSAMDAIIRRRGAYVCRSCTQNLQRQLRRAYSSAAPQPDIYDVVCVGGGPAGLSLLTALRE
jgi:ubiquinone biosynthesis monooxygenase Coq6